MNPLENASLEDFILKETDAFNRLSKSEFRSRFHLNAKEREYALEKGEDALREHARKFIRERLASASPFNDGKQTPVRGHPVFVAQHACACCCRGCLEKWHKIPRGRALKEEEISFIAELLLSWIRRDLARDLAPKNKRTRNPRQGELF